MHGGPHVEKWPFEIQWLGAYVIVIVVSNHSGCINSTHEYKVPGPYGSIHIQNLKPEFSAHASIFGRFCRNGPKMPKGDISGTSADCRKCQNMMFRHLRTSAFSILCRNCRKLPKLPKMFEFWILYGSNFPHTMNHGPYGPWTLYSWVILMTRLWA